MPRKTQDDDGPLFALVAGGAVAVLLFGSMSGQRIPALLGTLGIAAVLAWLLWRRWSRRAADGRPG